VLAASHVMSQPDLSQFFGCWFHQDCLEDADSWQGVARQFVATEGAAAADSTATAIMELARSNPSDHELSAALARLGSFYIPEHGIQAWLVALAQELQQLAANNSFKPNPLRGSKPKLEFVGRVGLIQVLGPYGC
jgi:hypothetical protein